METPKISEYLNKFFKSPDLNLIDTTFGYLMFLLYKNGEFNELHLPSENYKILENEYFYILKVIPPEYLKRVKAIAQMSKEFYKSNVLIMDVNCSEENIFVLSRSQIGVIKEKKDLSLNDKKSIIDLFFKSHEELKLKNYELPDFNEFISPKNAKNTFDKIKNLIDQKATLTEFDKKVIAHMQLINDFEFNPNILEFKKQPVHGDFILRNIIFLKENPYLIDFDIAQNGYMEIEFIRLLKDLFGLDTPEFYKELENTYKKKKISMTPKNMFELYCYRKLYDTSLLKSAYFSNNKKYYELQEYLTKEFEFIGSLVTRYSYFITKFNQLSYQ